MTSLVDGLARVDPAAGFSQACAAPTGGLVATAGQVAWGEPGEVVGEGDTGAQAEQVFDNLADVLGRLGCGLGDVVKLTCYLTPEADFEAYAEVKARRYPEAGPASTTVVVAALLDPRLLVEVEALAVVGAAGVTGAAAEGPLDRGRGGGGS